MNIVINGMGVLGRQLLKELWGRDGITIQGIADANISASDLAELLVNDSARGRWLRLNGTEWQDMSTYVSGNDEDSTVTIEAHTLNLYKDIYTADPVPESTVIDCTGEINSNAKAEEFKTSTGAARVVMCVPAGNDALVITYGINQDDAANKDFSIGNVESQAAALILHALQGSLTVNAVYAHFVESYNNGQNVQDSFRAEDYASGRAAAWNISPLNKTDLFTNTLGLVIPELNGISDATLTTVSLAGGAILNLAVEVSAETTVDAVNTLLSNAQAEAALGYSTDYLVSSDILNDSHTVTVLSTSTQVFNVTAENKHYVFITALFDPTGGFACNVAATVASLEV